MTEDQVELLVDIILDVHKKFMENVETRIDQIPYPDLLFLSGRARGATDIVKEIIAALHKVAEEGIE